MPSLAMRHLPQDAKLWAWASYLPCTFYNSREIRLSVPAKGTWIQMLSGANLIWCFRIAGRLERARVPKRADCLVGYLD